MVLNAAFEKQGKEGGQARVDGSQYKTKERVTRIGCAECTSRRELFLETVRETRTAMLNIALRQPKSSSPSAVWPQSSKTLQETYGET